MTDHSNQAKRLFLLERKNCAEIGRELGISRQAVWQLLRRRGVPTKLPEGATR